MSAMAEGQRVRVAEGVLGERLGVEAVVLDTRTGRYFRLSETGARLWQLLEVGMSLSEATSRLLAEYDVDAQTLERDVAELVAELVAERLLVLA